jgi:hypothetical protein
MARTWSCPAVPSAPAACRSSARRSMFCQATSPSVFGISRADKPMFPESSCQART